MTFWIEMNNSGLILLINMLEWVVLFTRMVRQNVRTEPKTCNEGFRQVT
jgi:hypothetical protein